MTMPKKGTRKIVVGDQAYRWKCKTYDWGEPWNTPWEHEVVIERPDGTIIKKNFKEEGLTAITPKMVEEIILGSL